jgi:hypothetical protein
MVERRPQQQTPAPSQAQQETHHYYKQSAVTGPGFLERHETMLFLLHFTLLVFFVLMLLRLYTKRAIKWTGQWMRNRFGGRE